MDTLRQTEREREEAGEGKVISIPAAASENIRAQDGPTLSPTLGVIRAYSA